MSAIHDLLDELLARNASFVAWRLPLSDQLKTGRTTGQADDQSDPGTLQHARTSDPGSSAGKPRIALLGASDDLAEPPCFLFAPFDRERHPRLRLPILRELTAPQPAAEPMADPVVEPVADPASDSASEPASEPASGPGGPAPGLIAAEPQLSEGAFKTLVQQGQRLIASGRFEKFVPSRSRTLQAEVDLAALFELLLEHQPGACVYLLNHPQAGTWLGATPERLLRSEGAQVETLSLAGTRTREAAAGWTAKEYREQQLVTDFLRDALLAAGCTGLQVEGPFDREAGHLMHLATYLRARYPESLSAEHLAERLHPSPAVCGQPALAAMEFLREAEGYDRSYYAGYLGFVESGRVDLYVNLRCLRRVSGGLQLFAGAGVTADSDPQAEWHETGNKMNTLESLIDQLASGPSQSESVMDGSPSQGQDPWI